MRSILLTTEGMSVIVSNSVWGVRRVWKCDMHLELMSLAADAGAWDWTWTDRL